MSCAARQHSGIFAHIGMGSGFWRGANDGRLDFFTLGDLDGLDPWAEQFLRAASRYSLWGVGSLDWHHRAGVGICDLFVDLWRRFGGHVVGIRNSIHSGDPKAIVLFAAVFPQFLDPSQPTTPQFLALGATYLASEFVASAVYAVGGLQIRRLMTSPRGARRVGQATGGVFVGAGALLLTAQR